MLRRARSAWPLYSPELDGIEESEWGREHAVVNWLRTCPSDHA
ncbi:MAG: hypothetical protein M5U27_15355 [Gaiella sp.]|nr:hypothetical protein [Gaiella sp.]